MNWRLLVVLASVAIMISSFSFVYFAYEENLVRTASGLGSDHGEVSAVVYNPNYQTPGPATGLVAVNVVGGQP